MIGDAMEYIRREVRTHLGVTDGEVRIDSARVISDNGPQGALITLINIEEESTLRNTPHIVQNSGRMQYREPSVFMNLFILFSFDFIDYGSSLMNLSSTISLFQDRRYLSSSNAAAGTSFPAGIDRLLFEHHNLSFEALNNLWSVMGGSHYPSVIYKVRLVELRHTVVPQDANEITEISVETARI